MENLSYVGGGVAIIGAGAGITGYLKRGQAQVEQVEARTERIYQHQRLPTGSTMADPLKRTLPPGLRGEEAIAWVKANAQQRPRVATNAAEFAQAQRIRDALDPVKQHQRTEAFKAAVVTTEQGMGTWRKVGYIGAATAVVGLATLAVSELT